MRVGLASNQVAPPMVREALGRLMRTESSNLNELAESTAVRSLEVDDQFWLAQSFNRTQEHLRLAVSLWERLLAVPDFPEERIGTAQHFLGVSYMGLGRCSAAAGMFRKEGQGLADLTIADAFNYAMALWGMTQMVETEAFQHVVDRRSIGCPGGQDHKLSPVHGAGLLGCGGKRRCPWLCRSGASNLECPPRTHRV